MKKIITLLLATLAILSAFISCDELDKLLDDEIETNTEAESNSESHTENETESKLDVEIQTETETDINTENITDTKIETETETNTDSNTNSISDTETEDAEACIDEDKNHICDDCGSNVGDHADAKKDGDHECDYCGATINVCSDINNDGICDDCKIKYYSGRLNYSLNSDGKGYSVIGIGGCKDTDIIFPSVYNKLPVTAIKERAFSGCATITSITIPDSIVSIEYQAFSSCINLATVRLGKGVKDIRGQAFIDSQILTITVDEGNSSYKVVNGNLYTADEKTLVQYAVKNSASSFIIPDGVENIASNAFCGAHNLINVTIPNSVKEIGDFAFSGCDNIKSITIPDNVESIGFGAFFCDNLTSVIIGSGVTYISSFAFNDNSNSKLVSAEFKNPNGWFYYSSDYDILAGTEISSTELANPETAAMYLKNLINYRWERKNK